MNHVLRVVFRLVFVIWFAGVLACGAWVAAKTRDSSSVFNLMTFLFTRGATSQQEMTPSLPLVVQEQIDVAPPAPAPEPMPPSKPQPRILPSGSLAGKGVLSTPRLDIMEDGTTLLRIPYTGTLGEKKRHKVSNVASVTLDLLGNWTGLDGQEILVSHGLIKKIQIGLHNGYIRFSGLAVDLKMPTSLQGEIYVSPAELIITYGPGIPDMPVPVQNTSPVQDTL